PLSTSSVLSSGTQDPQPVPAFVHDFTSPTEERPFSTMASQICALLRLWHEQTWASSGRAPEVMPAAEGAIIVSGSAGSGRPTSGRSAAYRDVSPTSTPPSRVVAASSTTSFA